MTRHGRLALTVGLVIAVASPAVATAQTDGPPRTAVDLANAPALLGGGPGVVTVGRSVAGLGDVDGDGRTDLAVGTDGPLGYPDASARQGALQIAFGPLADRLPFGAVRGILVRPLPGAIQPLVASPGGDVDADGLDDVLVVGAGGAWIVWGRAEPGIVDLADPGGAATRIALGSGFASAAAGDGDVDGDGVDDVVVGVSADAARARSRGALAVVYGTPGDRRATAAPRSVIGGLEPGTGLGSAVAMVGDTDGDGRAEVAASTRWLDPRPVARPERVWLVRGAADRSSVNLAAGGPRVTVFTTGDSAGGTTPVPWPVGDVDGDGRADLAIDDPAALEVAPRIPAGVVLTMGRVSIVRGARMVAGEMPLGALGAAGTTIRDVPDGADRLGGSGIAALDRDGDGRSEPVLGGVVRDVGIHSGVGAVLVLRDDLPAGTYRSDDPAVVERIVVVRRGRFSDAVPTALAAVGDQDVDGAGDLLLGVDRAAGAACRRPGGAAVLVSEPASLPADPGSPEQRPGPIVLRGGSGSDQLDGSLGDDLLEGMGGDDCLHGAYRGNDVLRGGDGNDMLETFHGPARLEGGPGDDVVVDNGEELPPVADVLLGGDGNDELFHQYGAVTIDAGAGDDVVSDGGEGIVLLGPGDDRYVGSVTGSIGKGTVSGRHRVDAGAGDDRVSGGRRRDVLRGGDGDDVLDAGYRGEDRDLLLGGPGADVLSGGVDDDRLNGDDGRDRLDGARGADRLRGGRGDDRLVGGPGRDDLAGGPGVDVIQAADGERDVVRCDGDRDRVVADPRDRLVGCHRARVTLRR